MISNSQENVLAKLIEEWETTETDEEETREQAVGMIDLLIAAYKEQRTQLRTSRGG